MEPRLDDVSSWFLPLLRAVPAIAVAAVVTFSADHSSRLGLITFGSFAVIVGIVMGVFALRETASTSRTLRIVQGGIGVVAGVAALAVIDGGLPYLIFLVSTWGAITGFLELYLGLRSRGTAVARDHIFVGALTVVLAVAVLVVPPDFVQPYTGPDGVARELTASIIVVGLLGAYWAIIGVFLVIAAFSLKWADAPAVETKA